MKIFSSGSRLAVSAALALVGIAQAQAQFANDAPSSVGASPNNGAAGADAGSPFAVWAAHTESSNVLRTAGGARGSYDTLGTLFNVARIRSRLQAGLAGNLEVRKYADDAAEEERLGALAAFANAILVPERFTWSFRESYTQGRTNPFGADSPGNRENISIFTTRPEVTLPLGGRTALTLSTSYSDRTYSESSLLDSDAVTYQVGLLRQPNTTTTLGLLAQTTEVDYEATPYDYDIEALQIVYTRQLASGNARAAAGQNKLIFDGVERSAPMFQLEWFRVLTPRSTLTLTADRGFTDSGQLSNLGQGGSPVESPDVLLSADASNQQRAAIAYSLQLSRVAISLGAAYIEDEFERDTALNSDTRELTFGISRELSLAMSVGAGVQRLQRNFSDSQIENDETLVRIWLNRQITRRLSFEAHVQRADRTGIDEFEEDLYEVRLVYNRGGVGQ